MASSSVASKAKKVTVKKARKNEIRIKYFEESVKTVLVNFQDFFGEESAEYNEFTISLASKKAYFKMIKLIVNENNMILNRNDELAQSFLYRYFSIKKYIDDLKYQNKSVDIFYSDLYSLFDEPFVNEIKKYVNENYKKDVGDEYGEDKKKYEESITFLDYHIKILFVISRMIRLVIPLCIHYIHVYPGTVETNQFLVQAFTQLFNIAQCYGRFNFDDNNIEEIKESKTDIYQKLYLFVQRRVEKTLHTDKTMWDRQAFFAVNPKSAIEDILNKLITNIIPEYSFKQKVMHLNTVMIKKTVSQYILRKKDPFLINCIIDSDASQVDDDNIVSESEIFDSYSNRKNELTILTRKIFNTDTVNKIMERNNIYITPDEFQFYYTTNQINNFQQFIIFQTFFKYFGGTENMYAINKTSYTQLLIILIKLLNNVDIPEMIKWVTGKRTKHYINKRESRSLRNIISSDTVYKNIVETKYKNVQNIILRNNFIESKILFLVNNEFVYNEYKNPNNGSVIERNENDIKDTVLKYFSRVIV